jgi:alkanesulfonate monooxygenase SsuD/methylene tetrahydromethanopterin reductase-like flavin-dependent oxidoreductase (luciferase family)
MTAATFRLPGPLAIAVAQVDQMSGGRVELGIGAGWYDDEHRAYGIPFPNPRERFDRLEDQLAIVTGLWTTPEGERFSFESAHYRLHESPARPKPVQQPHPPIVMGGLGTVRTPRLAARYANEFNAPFASVDTFRTLQQRVTAACEAEGRDPATMTWSAALVVCCGSDEAEVQARAKAIGREPGELRENGLAGTPSEVVDKLRTYAEAGLERVYLQVLDLSDLDHLRLVAAEVVPAFAS